MARPRGLRMNRAALHDLLTAKHLSMTEAADRCGMPLTTLSSLVHGHHRAGMRTVRQLTEGLACSAETLFPELAFRDLEHPQRGAA